VLNMDCVNFRLDCLGCLSANCFFAVFPDLSTFCAADPSIFYSKENLLVSPGNWRLCPAASSSVVSAPAEDPQGSIERFIGQFFDVGHYGRFFIPTHSHKI